MDVSYPGQLQQQQHDPNQKTVDVLSLSLSLFLFLLFMFSIITVYYSWLMSQMYLISLQIINLKQAKGGECFWSSSIFSYLSKNDE